ncbi:hypothetical protein, partial [Vibrio anguillarum]
MRTATIPLTYSDKDENNIVTVTTKDTDGKQITFKVPVQHIDAVKLVEELAFERNSPYRFARNPKGINQYTGEHIDLTGQEESQRPIEPA